jgi:hypothetical protein
MRQLAVLRSIGCGLFLGAACSGGNRPAAAGTTSGGSPPQAASVADSSVDVGAQAACQVGDTLLRQVPGTVLRWSPAVAFDSLWHGATNRWACRVAAVGRVPSTYAPIDSLLEWLKARGWLDHTTISADGPDGTIQGVRRSGVTCLVEGRWDGGDDADTTYVPSDTMEVHFACTRTVAADTLAPS